MTDDNVLTYRVGIYEEEGSLWAEVKDLPGCFATGDNEAELIEALSEAISLYLSHPNHPIQVRFLDSHDVDDVREQHYKVEVPA